MVEEEDAVAAEEGGRGRAPGGPHNWRVRRQDQGCSGLRGALLWRPGDRGDRLPCRPHPHRLSPPIDDKTLPPPDLHFKFKQFKDFHSIHHAAPRPFAERQNAVLNIGGTFFVAQAMGTRPPALGSWADKVEKFFRRAEFLLTMFS